MLRGVVRVAFVSLVLSGGCSSGVEPFPSISEYVCQPDQLDCDGNVAATCNAQGTAWLDRVECIGRSPECVVDLGCVACLPGDRRCQGNDVLACDEDGAGWSREETCDGEYLCYDGRCGADCARAGVFRSYEGCEYVAVTLMNSQLSSDFRPALVIGNGNSEPATVTVSRSFGFSEEITVEPDTTATLELPWNTELKNARGTGASTNLADVAFRVESTVPVTVYQFNPLEYSLPRDCSSGDTIPGDGLCFSYSNDASLLLPVPALTQHYIVMSRPTLGVWYEVVGGDLERFHFSPSVVAVANPQDEVVTVEVTLSAPIAAGTGVEAMDAGDIATFTLQPGGVLQLASRSPRECSPDYIEPEPSPCSNGQCTFGYCNLTELDLTGTEIVASAPVAVFGAHDCDFIPYNRWACDHLEEQLFPFETWGKHFVVSQSHREADEPDLWRVLSGADDNVLRFDPESVHGEVRLGRGELVEFEAHDAFLIEAERPVMVGQFLVGQNYSFVPNGEELPPGDPAFVLAVPVEQWRDSYNFLAPGTFDRSFVNITTHKDVFQSIVFDGESLDDEDWQMVGLTEYVVLRREIQPGSHSIRSLSDEPFGILVYGFGQYTSYMVPGGLDLEPIAMW